MAVVSYGTLRQFTDALPDGVGAFSTQPPNTGNLLSHS